MNILTFGAVTNQASYCDAQRGMMKLDIRITQSAEKCYWIGEAVAFAEAVGNTLRKNLKQMIAPAKNDRGTGDVQRAVHEYFSVCEGLFYEAASRIAQCKDEAVLPDEMQKWQDIVGKAARKNFHQMQDIYCNTAEELIRAEEAYKWLSISIAKLKDGK